MQPNCRAKLPRQQLSSAQDKCVAAQLLTNTKRRKNLAQQIVGAKRPGDFA